MYRNLRSRAGCRIFFAEERYGHHSNTELLLELEQDGMDLDRVIVLRGSFPGFLTLHEMMEKFGESISEEIFQGVARSVNTHDLVNLQYTSGSTGNPKAAMLTHQ